MKYLKFIKQNSEMSVEGWNVVYYVKENNIVCLKKYEDMFTILVKTDGTTEKRKLNNDIDARWYFVLTNYRTQETLKFDSEEDASQYAIDQIIYDEGKQKYITIEETNNEYDTYEEAKEVSETLYDGPKTESYFLDCVSIKFGYGTNTISLFAVAGCNELITVELPETLEHIGDFAFISSKKLKNIVIPNNVIDINEGAFEYCSSLESVTLPNKLETILINAFSDCPKLSSVTYKDVTYTSKSLLETNLRANGVSLNGDCFNNTNLKA